MTEKQKTPYERVASAMHGIDDTNRDCIVYPSRSDVVGISEGEDFVVFSHASVHDDGRTTQMVWINAESIDALEAVQDAITRVLDRAKEKEWKRQEEEG
jgi:hypothetical protein